MSETLVEMLQRGESRAHGYNDYNRYAPRRGGPGHFRGHDRDIDFSQMTLGEIQDSQNLPWNHSDKLHAVGRYQVIKGTLGDAMRNLSLRHDERFTPELQDRILVDYLMRDKPGREAIGNYVTGKDGATLRAAQVAMAREWASVAHPDTGGSLYENNHATITPMQSTEALQLAREQHAAAIARGVSPDDAWRMAAGLGLTPAQELTQASTMQQRGAHEPTVAQLQTNLNALNIRDARGQGLTVDGNRGGPSSHTNEAIASFQQRFGLSGQASNAELLTATQVALNANPARDFAQAMHDTLPPNPQPHTRSMINGMPDYLLPGRNAHSQAVPTPNPAALAGSYTITESVSNRRETVQNFEDLEKHHPSAGRELGRQYQTINGELEEVRVRDGVTFVKKDFILSQDVPGPLNIPAPTSGYVHLLNDSTNAVRIYDQPYGTPGAVMLAQSLHMERSTSPIEGTYICYGQPIGQIGDTGSPGSVHAHVEAPVEMYQRYIRDIAEARIRPGMTQGVPEQSPARAAPSQTVPISQAGMSSHPVLPEELIRTLQRQLNELGVRDAQGRVLRMDGDYGVNTTAAVHKFQQDQGLPATGVADDATRAGINAHAIVAKLQQDKAAREVQVTTTPVMPASPMSETADLHARLHPDRAGSDALRATYATLAPAVEMTTPRRAADVPDHFDLMQRAATPVNHQSGAQARQAANLQAGLHADPRDAADINRHETNRTPSITPQMEPPARQTVTAQDYEALGWIPPQMSSPAQSQTGHAGQTGQDRGQQGQQEQQEREGQVQLEQRLQTQQAQERLIRQEHERRTEQDQEERDREQQMSAPSASREPALRPFSDPKHPEHALYADVKGRLEAQGQHFPEDRLNQITATLHAAEFKPGWKGRVDVENDTVYAQNFQNLLRPGAHVSLQEPAPSIQASMQAVDTNDRLNARMHHEFVQQQQTGQAQHGAVMGR